VPPVPTAQATSFKNIFKRLLYSELKSFVLAYMIFVQTKVNVLVS
jgi:hypothetical protein